MGFLKRTYGCSESEGASSGHPDSATELGVKSSQDSKCWEGEMSLLYFQFMGRDELNQKTFMFLSKDAIITTQNPR